MDGRDRKDYEASHVPGAISMPYFDLYFEWRSAKYVDLARRVVASGRHVVCYANTGGTEGMGAGRCMRLCNFFYECWKVPVDRMHRLRDGYADWKYMTVRHWGESANGGGAWKLKVEDVRAGNGPGTFVSWTLQVHGHSSGCSGLAKKKCEKIRIKRAKLAEKEKANAKKFPRGKTGAAKKTGMTPAK